MMMSRSEAQQTTSPLFVDKEENDVENVIIDTTLPFDRCLSVDKQCEEEENANKKNIEMLEYQNKLGDVKTTLKDSKKQIDNWLGKNIIFKYRLNHVIIGIIGLVMIAALIYFIPILTTTKINSNHYNEAILNVVSLFASGLIAIFIVLAAFLVFILIFDMIVIPKRELIKKKMSRDDYLINSNIVDCPMKVKTELFDDLVDRKYLYTSYNKKENALEFYKDCSNETLDIYKFDSHDRFAEKDSLEYQCRYLSTQLKDGKFYRIADIITDEAVKEKNVYE